MLFSFLISHCGEGFLIDISEQYAAPLIKRLSMYKLRADVSFEKRDDVSVWVALSNTTQDALNDERAEGLGQRAYTESASDDQGMAPNYNQRRIKCCIPEMDFDYTSGGAFSHEVLLDITGGLDFKKGCYVGQEVVSRVEHRSTARKRFVSNVGSNSDLPIAGTEVKSGNKSIGTMGSSVGREGLALVRIDKVEPTSGVTCEGQTVILSSPPFADFAMPGDTDNRDIDDA